MSELKTLCSECGISIRPLTAAKSNGMCRPCFHKAEAIPAPDFELPPDLVNRIQSLGEDPKDYLEEAWRSGVDSVRRHMDAIAECHSLYQARWPKLLDFVRGCRQDDPPPVARQLTLRDRAILQVYKSKIDEAGPPGGGKNQAIFCCLPAFAHQAAKKSWPGSDDRCVVLTQQEKERWQEIYTDSEGEFGWFVNYWWNVEDCPKSDGVTAHAENLLAPVGAEPWLVTTGVQWGALAGGATTELWSWDGQQPSFAEITDQIQF